MTRSRYAVLALVTISIGLVWRLAPLGLPPLWYKYGGSALWAIMVYWLVAAIFSRISPIKPGMTAAAVACGVEFFRLVHTPALDAFRLTLAGKLLIGRVFSLRDIAVYWLAIAGAATLDRYALRRKPSMS